MNVLKVVILEPAFAKLIGHYADVTMRICKEFQRHGHSVTVYASEKATPEVIAKFSQAGIEVRPHFRVPTKWIRNLFGKKFASWVRLRVRGEDFENVRAANLYLWPTFESQFFLPLRYLGGSKNIVAGAWFDMPLPSTREFRENRTSVLSRYCLGSYDERLQLHLNRQFEITRFGSFPIPYDGSPEPNVGLRPISVGLFGHIQKSRGETMLASLRKSIVESGWRYNLNGVEYPAPSGGGSIKPPVGYIEDIAPLIAQCHFVLWPSDADHYKLQTSGNVFQCIANGTPVVVPKGCLPCRILSDFGLDYPRFDEQSSESVMKAAHALMANYEAFKDKALVAAQMWREKQGVSKFVEHMIKLTTDHSR
jgi:hypothetical protein